METKEIQSLYNDQIQSKFGTDYEHDRWFKTPILKAGYDATYESITRHLLGDRRRFYRCLELGPGAGTWTKLLIENRLASKYDLLDISKSMLVHAKKSLSEYENISYLEQDFLEFTPNTPYDIFFSSRAVEYIPDAEKMVKKIDEVLLNGGVGFIITKTPHYARYRLMGRIVPEMHRTQISSRRLRSLLFSNGFTDIKMYPVSMSFPFLRSAKMNRLLYSFFGGLSLNPISQFFSESYCVVFEKP